MTARPLCKQANLHCLPAVAVVPPHPVPLHAPLVLLSAHEFSPHVKEPVKDPSEQLSVADPERV